MAKPMTKGEKELLANLRKAVALDAIPPIHAPGTPKAAVLALSHEPLRQLRLQGFKLDQVQVISGLPTLTLQDLKGSTTP